VPDRIDIRKDMTGIEMLKDMEKKIEVLVREIKQLRTAAPKYIE
jgi:hypothetical protein